jgi:hypothetical protein
MPGTDWSDKKAHYPGELGGLEVVGSDGHEIACSHSDSVVEFFDKTLVAPEGVAGEGEREWETVVRSSLW